MVGQSASPGRRNPIKFVLVAVAVAILAAAATADWRFWYRWFTLPEDAGEWPDSYYQPTVAIDGDPREFFPAAGPAELTIDPAALAAAAAWADAHNSAALLVLHKGVIQLEQYWRGIEADSLFTGRAMTRTLIPPLIAIAVAEGSIESLDDPAERYLPEWQGDPRGRITIRQLLQNVSGLENPAMAGDANPYNKNNRLSLGSSLRRTALSFELAHPPGEFFELSNANAQLLGAILESATGMAYEEYANSRLWAPLGAGRAEFYFDRPGGMPTVYCCFRATPRDWLRFGHALSRDGLVEGRQLWPAGWVGEMTTPSAAYPNYGYQVWVGNPPGPVRPYIQGGDLGAPHGEPIAAEGVFFLEGGGYRTLYVMPQEELVILRLGYFHPEWQTSAIPNLVLGGIKRPE